jgi:hypothetical protein
MGGPQGEIERNQRSIVFVSIRLHIHTVAEGGDNDGMIRTVVEQEKDRRIQRPLSSVNQYMMG